MAKAPPELLKRPTNPTLKRHYHSKQRTTNMPTLPSIHSPNLFLLLLVSCALLFTLLQLLSIHTAPSLLPSISLFNQWQKLTNCTPTPTQLVLNNSITQKLQKSVTFLPLKDLRYADQALKDHTWFMSSMYDTHEEGEVQYQEFPSNPSSGRLLCLKGKDTHDGSWNSYALAWPEALPFKATFLKGLTFVSYNHYNYDNIWHGLSSLFPFVAWHMRNGSCALPKRWVMYHWGELRFNMGLWLKTLMEATFNGPPYVEGFEWANESDPICFERAVVMRHNEGGMSRDRRMETYDLIRCKARRYCNVTTTVEPVGGGRSSLVAVGMTLFMRNGPRSFRNESVVIRIFDKECSKVDGCKLRVAYSNNLTVCEQVKLMSLTDILISPHGAQLTNMFLMDRNSSVMEFFPKGWLKLAGVGQYVYHWTASWSGMRHQGAWRDTDGPPCPYPEDDRRCMSVYKGATIGYNETYFAEWARRVLDEVKARKLEEATRSKGDDASLSTNNCACA